MIFGTRRVRSTPQPAKDDMSEIKHSPLPWQFIRHDNIIADATHKVVAIQCVSRAHSEAQRDADTCYIIGSCNNHSRLVAENAALREALEWYADKENWRGDDYSCAPSDGDCGDHALAALAAVAKGDV